MVIRAPSLQRRLLPLHVGVLLQGCMLWVPVEKLFLAELGFDAAAVGLMAAVYAGVVPLVEVPAGVLADRWSRRGVLVLATAALALSSLLGGLATGVPGYLLAAAALGGYFALYSGTLDAVVYDTVLEETGDGAGFERRIGRVRLVEGVALVGSALLGGWLADLTSTRLTYLVSVPFGLLAALAFLRFREPRLHRAEERVPLRRHLAVTARAVVQGGRLLPVVALAVLSGALLQLVFEFGPLWLVALAVPAVAYGPYWAGLISTLGLGGLLAGRLALDRTAPAAATAALLVVSAFVLTTAAPVAAVVGAQVVLALLLVVAGIHVARLLHDAVPSGVRAGVASGVSTITWTTFLPVALAVGVIGAEHGVRAAGWVLTAAAALTGALLVRAARARRGWDGHVRTAAPPDGDPDAAPAAPVPTGRPAGA
jgi:MFS family permease